MINTNQFRTKTISKPRKNPSINGKWGIGIDVGYSAVKAMSPNSVNSFPSVAVKVPFGTADNTFGKLSNASITYRDTKGNEYLVGEDAEKELKGNDSAASILYTRDRYNHDEFLVVSRVGLALSSLANQYSDPKDQVKHVMTGLPPEYMAEDEPIIKDIFTGTHEFSIKIGNRPDWIKFGFELKAEDIHVMEQPMGSLISLCIDANGGMIKEAATYMSSNILIFDPGFGTLDTFEIRNHRLGSNKTWTNLGMRRVLQETVDELKREYGLNTTVSALEVELDKGYVSIVDKRSHSSKRQEFGEILQKANKKVCYEALDAIDSVYDYLSNYDYLAIAGGTGAAWDKFIRERYKEMETLSIISASQNDPNLDPIFSNVRGYYMQLLQLLKK